MGRLTFVAALAVIAAGCGGGGSSPPQLVDGSPAADIPAVLGELDNAVATRVHVWRASDYDRDRLDACGLEPATGETAVVERIGVQGSSLTFAGTDSSLYGCSRISDPFQEPDRPGDGYWCGGAAGRLDADGLNDPRLTLCTAEDGDLTAFVWVEPRPETKWVLVSDAGRREIYEVVESLPVRVTTTDGVESESSRASFDIEEYAADGTKLREYTLDAQVAG